MSLNNYHRVNLLRIIAKFWVWKLNLKYQSLAIFKRKVMRRKWKFCNKKVKYNRKSNHQGKILTIYLIRLTNKQTDKESQVYI